MDAPTDMRDRLIVALDVPDILTAAGLVNALGESVSFYKIGYQLTFAGGLMLAQELVARGKRVFLDMKLLDIDNTVRHGVESIAHMGVSMLTVHAYPKAMAAAAEAAKGTGLTVLGVTVLTSMDMRDLSDAGYHDAPATLAAKRARQARQAGLGGVVCSAEEAEIVRDIVGDDLAVVTPGIRLQAAAGDDQKRVTTPEAAIRAGASHIVVGRPIIAATDPAAAARAVLESMARGA